MIAIGIDGGGTRTRLMIRRDHGEPEFIVVDRSIKVRAKDYAASATALHGILEEVLPGAVSEIRAIAIGLAGMGRDEDQMALAEALRAVPELAKIDFVIDSDANFTFKSVIGDQEAGMVLILGTGSVCLMQPRGGGLRRIGGWGPLLSDDGSGYRIGLTGLRYYINVLDYVEMRTAVTDAIEQALPERIRFDPLEIGRYCEAHPEFVSGLARVILDVIEANNEEKWILQELLIELYLGLRNLMREDFMLCPPPWPLYLAGSVAHHVVMQQLLVPLFTEHGMEVLMIDPLAPCETALSIAAGLAGMAPLQA